MNLVISKKVQKKKRVTMRKLLFCHPALENKKNQFKEKMGFSYLQELKSKCLTTIIIIMTIDRFLVLFALSRLISSKHDFSQQQQLYQMLLAGVTAANPH